MWLLRTGGTVCPLFFSLTWLIAHFSDLLEWIFFIVVLHLTANQSIQAVTGIMSMLASVLVCYKWVSCPQDAIQGMFNFTCNFPCRCGPMTSPPPISQNLNHTRSPDPVTGLYLTAPIFHSSLSGGVIPCSVWAKKKVTIFKTGVYLGGFLEFQKP